MNRISKARRGDWNALDAYLTDIASQPAASDDEAAEIAGRAARGDVAARERLVRGHLRMVVRIAHGYAGFGLPLADLIAEGNIGLMRAAELYEPRFGTKFANYAIVWIKQRIHRAITAQARAVRIPMWRSQRLRKVARLNDELLAQLGRPPREEELAERLGFSADDLASVEADRIQVISLDAPLAPDGAAGDGLKETLPDARAADPDAALSRAELIDEMIAALHDLDDRELEVVAHKYGLGAGAADGADTPAPISFRELGRRWGLSGEWVRRIGELALIKLRRSLKTERGFTPAERRRRCAGVLSRLAQIAGRRAAAV
jgi:RNA polymerase primary sigma factor